MKSPVIKRSVIINGHKTSVSLEQPFWNIVRDIAHDERTTVSAVLRRIDEARQHANLSSAVRVYVLEHTRARVAKPADQPTPMPIESPVRQPHAGLA
jgi:predicted DNA-binding ribbon-helix-helix protein